MSLAELVAGLLDGGADRVERLLARTRASGQSRPRRRPRSPGLFPSGTFFSAWNTSQPIRSPSAKVGGAHRHDHEFLEVDRGVGVGAAVHDVHHRDRQDLGVRARRCTGRAAGPAPPPPPWPSRAKRRGWRWRRASTWSPSRRARSSPGRRRPGPGRQSRPGPARSWTSRSRPPSERPCRNSASCRRRAARSPRVRRCEAPDGTAARPEGAGGESDVHLDGGVAARVDDFAGGDRGDGCVHGEKIENGSLHQTQVGPGGKVQSGPSGSAQNGARVPLSLCKKRAIGPRLFGRTASGICET